MAIFTLTLHSGEELEYKLTQEEVKELFTNGKRDTTRVTFGSVDIGKDKIKKIKYDDNVCHHCHSKNIKCENATSNCEGKIVGKWVCLDCNGTYTTAW